VGGYPWPGDITSDNNSWDTERYQPTFIPSGKGEQSSLLGEESGYFASKSPGCSDHKN
jgi:hypothetical protein